MNPKYRKPPITEAILDLRVEPRPGASAIEIASAFAPFVDQYPKRQELPASLDFPFPPGFGVVVGSPNFALGGFRYDSADGRRVIQARRDGFIFSFVGSSEQRYPGWEDFYAEAERLWRQYREAWQPLKVVRVALRFVNQFDLSSATLVQVAASEFLTPLRIPRAGFLPGQELSTFGLQLTLPQNDIGATAVINNALLSSLPAPDGGTTVVLDIDLFQESLSLDPKAEEHLRERLSILRERKNQIFRAFITDAVEKSLEPIL